ncbi:hypothetical protein IC611_01495 [Proteus mirabilis]
MLLLLPALLTFGVDVWLRKRQRDAMSSRAQFYLPKANFQRDTLYLIFVMLICALFLLVFGTAVYSSFIQFWPYNLSFSLRHYNFEGLPGAGSPIPTVLFWHFTLPLSAAF